VLQPHRTRRQKSGRQLLLLPSVSYASPLTSWFTQALCRTSSGGQVSFLLVFSGVMARCGSPWTVLQRAQLFSK
jgi:hypothetical protein